MSVQAPPQLVIERHYRELVTFVDRVNRGALAFMRDGGGQVVPTSWWRSVFDNGRVGGHPESQHLLGLGVDLAVEPEQIQQLADSLRRVGLVVAVYRRHVHVQYDAAGFVRAAGWRVTDAGQLVDQFGRAV